MGGRSRLPRARELLIFYQRKEKTKTVQPLKALMEHHCAKYKRSRQRYAYGSFNAINAYQLCLEDCRIIISKKTMWSIARNVLDVLPAGMSRSPYPNPGGMVRVFFSPLRISMGVPPNYGISVNWSSHKLQRTNNPLII